MWILNFLLATTVDDKLGHRMEEVASLMVRFEQHGHANTETRLPRAK